jgi:DNA repair protein RecN (Recombination protein N)
MLISLHIENFTIINECSLELENGMTVLTGETGAGKSILVDALGFVLGGRADSKMLRHGSEQADISANFWIAADCEAAKWLQAEGYDSEECLLRRVLTKEGRSKAYINGKPATIQQLKALGSLLVNIHGQHEHYALLKRENQLTRLDYYLGQPSLLAQVTKAFNAWQNTQEKLIASKTAQSQSHARLELLRYQTEELEQLALAETELDNLHQEQQKLAHAQELMQLCANALSILYDNEQDTIHSQLNSLHKQFADATKTHHGLSSIATMLHDAMINIKECSHELQDYHEGLGLDPERLQTVELRLDTIYKVARKHKITPENLYHHLQSLQAELASIGKQDSNIEHLQQQLQQQAKEYEQLAAKLTAARQKAAKTLSKEVSKSLQELGMSGGIFNIEFESLTDYSAHGLERIAFMVSTNPGQPLAPMSDVVSGGELSRIGLAIQVLTAERSTTPTLIFDEVDVGIGGGTAEIVGKLLRKLSEHCQVLCVTHLPQVAAQALHHIYVEKHKAKDSTASEIHLLNQDGRVKELARMLGGVQITEQTLKHAKEMLLQAQ